MKQITLENNFIYLFFSLLGFLFSAALMAEFSDVLSQDIFSLVTLVMLVLSIKSLKPEKTWKRSVYLLIAIFVVLTILQKFFDHQFYIYLTLIILLMFFIVSFSTAARQVLLVGKVDRNKIMGSLSLYLLLGLIWTMIYLILLYIDPTVFSGLEITHWKESFSRVSYYSFVTLTTLGYGDILPTDRVAEFFVYLEAIIGVFYMAIIVASLISLRMAALQKENEEQIAILQKENEEQLEALQKVNKEQ
jgi:voltage-gated potassium channel Kch